MASVDDDNSNSNLTNSSASNISSASQQSSVNLKSSMLRPSALSWSSSSMANTPNTSTEVLNSNSCSSLSTSNPFTKSTSDENGSAEKKDEVESKAEAADRENSDPLSLISRNGLPKSNLFNTTGNPIASNTGFVFGQNLHERVTGNTIDAKDTGEKSDSAEEAASGGPSGGLFFSAAQQSQNSNASNSANSQKSLTEVAREYEESRAQKRKYEEVETITGEEDEKNILDINCKLFTFTASTWEERGRGSLRLNDPKSGRTNGISRVVFRAAGSHRVLLNTKIWRDMVAERSSQKSIRLTAIDSSGQIKVYLVMARPSDINTLYMALQRRIDMEMQKPPEAEAGEKTNDVKNHEHDDKEGVSPKKKATVSDEES
ncbi:ran-binding protein 3 isoform X2 [Phlebotomus argentipes]|uniref:ran-binding protein 3 isoform X2 n=1 Tax=Phlebotomus argentipes TaxID=94469 RepID=UPI0028930D2A|nr:ran-binding protein 3 isoform X2 [Phlebotomus argentipes]